MAHPVKPHGGEHRPSGGVASWDDVRFFLIAARSGSMNAAAKVFGVDHTTVGRRIGALEGRLNTRLFERRSNGLRLTEAGLAALTEAEVMEQASLRLVGAVAASGYRLEGKVRLGVTEGLASYWLIPRLQGFQQANPAIEISFDAAHAFTGLGEHVDAAMRFSAPDRLDEIGRRGPTLRFSLFAHTDYAERHGLPQSIDELPRHTFVDHTAYLQVRSLGPWNSLLKDLRVTLRSSNYLSVRAGLLRGLGLALLPNYVVFEFPELVKAPIELGMNSETWIVYREASRRIPRLQAVISEILRLAKLDQKAFFD
jgi:DNA-binding transcriptional LysR family regulator